MKRQELKPILISILVGACVAFLTSLFDGLIGILQGYGNNVTGGVIAAGIFKSLRA